MNKRHLRAKVRRLEPEKLVLLRELFSLQKYTNQALAMLEARHGIEGVRP